MTKTKINKTLNLEHTQRTKFL